MSGANKPDPERERFDAEERAAILEFDGGFSREEAKRRSGLDATRRLVHH